MRQFLPLAAILVAIVGARADEKLNAPIPKAPVPPTLDGKYTLLATFGGSGPTPKGGGGGFGPAGVDGGVTRVARSETIITKNEITIEGRTVAAAPTVMEYTFDPTKSPMTIDVETISVRGKRTKALGIVEITNNRLIIALAKDGGERPKTTEEADGVTIYYFQKAPPPPRVEFRIVAMTVGKEEAAEKELNKLSQEGYELVSTTNPIAADSKASVTTIHFVLKRTVKQP
jgi:uncharacterized protein (TIGR03067 family)